MNIINPLNNPICLTFPARIAMSAWIGHVPFAMYLIDILRPKMFAELGTHYGVSYCAFCQAVKDLGLDTRCYAIDTWEGDPHAGFYGPEVLLDLKEHHDPLYGGFSRLVQSTFEEARGHFPDGSFDLLHLDGYHTYEIMKRDLEQWLPKMSKRGVIIMHDINVRERDFGGWKLWGELKQQYPNFEFSHSHGLGVLGVGQDLPEGIRALFNCTESEATAVRHFFSQLGARLEAAQELQTLRQVATALPALRREKEALEAQLRAQDEQMRAQDAQMREAPAQVAALTQQLQERDGLLQQREARMIALSGELEELRRQAGEREALVAEKERQSAEAARLREREEELTARILGLGAQIHEKERQVGNLASLLNERDSQLQDKDRQFQLMSQQAQEQEEREQQKKNQILTLELRIKDRDAQATSLSRRLHEMQLKLEEHERLIESYRATVEDFGNSGSYRLGRALTWPLRLLKKTEPGSFDVNAPTDVSRYVAPAPSGAGHAPEPRPEEKAKEEASFTPKPAISTGTPAASTRTSAVSTRTQAVASAAAKAEHRPPAALFDAEWYLRQNPDVAQKGLDPLTHYLGTGAKEGRAPHPLFDPKFYLKTYPDAAISGLPPLQHYLTEGWRKGYRPNPKFDPSFYLSNYPDIARSGVEPLTHFITDGLREGRAGCREDVYFEPFEAAFEIPRRPLVSNSPLVSDVKAIAFYLPQFHPIPENDKWWGEGFTEWTNVRRGQPQFKHHYQPHTPSGLGYYDLREPHVLERQVQLARDYGVYGFCFYYYWFAGKVLLDLPVRRMLETGQPDFPFCICWANENWTRRWDGRESDILIAQQHSPEDDLAFLRNIQSILLHRNYIRVEGKPLLIIYQPGLLPDARATAARWRDYFRAQGHGEIFLAATQTFGDTKHPKEYGFDAIIQFPPHTKSEPVNSLVEEIDKSFEGQVYDYNRTKQWFLDDLRALSLSRRVYPGVMPSWDNTARRRNTSSVWINSSPESYYDWLSQVCNFLRRGKTPDEKFVFVNAWNEWAEGCHLEPDQLYSFAWLNATRLALQATEESEEG